MCPRRPSRWRRATMPLRCCRPLPAHCLAGQRSGGRWEVWEERNRPTTGRSTHTHTHLSGRGTGSGVASACSVCSGMIGRGGVSWRSLRPEDPRRLLAIAARHRSVAGTGISQTSFTHPLLPSSASFLTRAPSWSSPPLASSPPPPPRCRPPRRSRRRSRPRSSSTSRTTASTMSSTSL